MAELKDVVKRNIPYTTLRRRDPCVVRLRDALRINAKRRGCSTPWVFFACTPRVLFVKLKNRVKEVDVRSGRNPKDLSDNKVTFTTKGSSSSEGSWGMICHAATDSFRIQFHVNFIHWKQCFSAIFWRSIAWVNLVGKCMMQVDEFDVYALASAMSSLLPTFGIFDNFCIGSP